MLPGVRGGDDVATPLTAKALADGLAAMRATATEANTVRQQNGQQAAAAAEAVAAATRVQQVTIGTAAAVTGTAVAGYAIWIVQGGALLTSFLTQMPFWRWFDPLPVLDSWDKAKTPGVAASGRRQRRAPWYRWRGRGMGGGSASRPATTASDDGSELKDILDD
jgi:hypothetical protein